MPTVHRFGPYRFYFYAHENREAFEPPHVHVRSANGSAAYWLEPVSLRDARATLAARRSGFAGSSSRTAIGS